MKEFTIISRTLSERNVIVRAASASEAMRLVRDNVEAPDFYNAWDRTESAGIIATDDPVDISRRFRHASRAALSDGGRADGR